LINSLWFS